MNSMQLGTPTANSYFDTFLFSHDGFQAIPYAIPDTLANPIPETTPDAVELLAKQDTVALPALRLPQVAPSHVIATRQRSRTLVSRMYSQTGMPTRALKTKLPRQRQSTSMDNMYETKVRPLSPLPQGIGNIPVTPVPDNTYYQRLGKLHGITYIPRSMTRQEPTIIDALIACGTLILICVCVMLFLYYIGM